VATPPPGATIVPPPGAVAPAAPPPAVAPYTPPARYGPPLPEPPPPEDRGVERSAAQVQLEPPLLDKPAEAAVEEKKPTPALPAGIAQFAIVGDKAAAGLKPDLDGLDWLQANGYRTVLQVRSPATEDAADRRQVERHGMTYASLEVTPQTLTRALVDRFSKAVSDGNALPVFVYDRDGQLAGLMWYLHFRLTERLPDDRARARAVRLGLRLDGADRTELWLAASKLLSEQP
jgi:protein tyrosine phosphatase (PTP) superfamily phosphohydrolase (DUF442 family)